MVAQPFVLTSAKRPNFSPEFRGDVSAMTKQTIKKPKVRKEPVTSVKKERLLISKRFLSQAKEQMRQQLRLS